MRRKHSLPQTRATRPGLRARPACCRCSRTTFRASGEGHTSPRDCVEPPRVRVGGAPEETAQERRPPSKGPAVAQAAHSGRETTMRWTTTTGTHSRDGRRGAARELATATVETVAEANAARVRSGRPRSRDEVCGRPGRRPTETVCCPSPRRYRSTQDVRGPCAAPGSAPEPTIDL